MNRRNAIISRYNPRMAIKGVNDKFATKELLAAAGVPVPRTLAIIRSREELQSFDLEALPEAWVVKPNHGRRGEGVMLINGRSEEGWRQANGEPQTPSQIRSHVIHMLDGEMSLESAQEDSALFEPLIRTHSHFARLVPFGLPDIRIICFRSIPLMAMIRLPTIESGGRANLHQGGVGAAINFKTGRIFRAVQGGILIENHPSTGARLIGEEIPLWPEMVKAAALCSEPLNLGYVGVDLVIDADEGVTVLECNAFPGLEIQNINGAGLADRLAAARRRLEPSSGLFTQLFRT
jgi:alpha-L-glutamate ligase-like protein